MKRQPTKMQELCRKRFVVKGQFGSLLGLARHMISYSKLTKTEIYLLEQIVGTAGLLFDNCNQRTEVLKDGLRCAGKE